eukprot:jgi/Bigna1/90723/estExt_fgenesh1_pg.C_770101
MDVLTGALFQDLFGWFAPLNVWLVRYTTQFYCPDGKYHVLATIFFNSPENAIRFLYYEPSNDHISSHCNLPPSALVVFLVPYLAFMCLVYGIAIPSGRLSGYLLGSFQMMLGIEVAEHGAYALIGSAAMLGGVTRMTISLTLIIIETTGVVQFGLPVFLTALAARTCGHLVPFLPWDPPTWYQSLRARDVMSYNPICLELRVRAESLLRILSTHKHNGFPIVNTVVTGSTTKRRLVGIILRKHICAMLSERLREKVLTPPGTAAKSGENVELNWDDLNRTYPHFPAVENLRLNEVEKQYIVDFSIFMNLTPHRVLPTASVWHVYQLFRQMGLRHLCVVDTQGDIIGMITRQDLTIEHCKQCWEHEEKTPSFRKAAATQTTS